MKEVENYLEEQTNGVFVYVRVTPNASRARIGEVENNRLKIYVTVPPEDGKANKAVIQLLSKHFETPKSKIKLVSGNKSREKVFFIVKV